MRFIFTLTFAGLLLVVPFLCIAGVVEHECACESDVCCEASEQCETDLCGDIVARAMAARDHIVAPQLTMLIGAQTPMVLATESTSPPITDGTHDNFMPFSGSPLPLLI